ncbi:hypothetical protein ACFU99_41130 [Streptomyces sp. NPDC057654]|uniref:hypothetical protein n=1 Tax=Streptomyces sp. NPDC057654 TaxID=3346196 RepID=UPI0036A04311
MAIAVDGRPTPPTGPAWVRERILHAPHISENVWWVITVVTTALFLAVWLPILPSAKARSKVSLVPLLGVCFLSTMGKLRGHDLTTLLSIYSTVVLAFTLGAVGRRADVRIAVRQGEDPLGTPASQSEPATRRLTIQYLASLAVSFALYAWLKWGQ